jgi:hypothetical protein
MLEILLSTRPYLELAYFLAGVLLLVGLLITFYQLTLIKHDISLRNERAAKERAIEAVTRYLSDYVPKSNKVYHAQKEQGLHLYSGPVGDFSFESIPKPLVSRALKRGENTVYLPALNELEAISAYFTTGVADEQTGFQIIGRSFCASAEQLYDIIALCRTDKANAYWNNIVRLHQIWRPRLSQAEMRATIQDLQTKINSMGTSTKMDSVDR